MHLGGQRNGQVIPDFEHHQVISLFVMLIAATAGSVH